MKTENQFIEENKEEIEKIVSDVIRKTKQNINGIITKKLGIIKSDIAGTDEDINISGETDEFKQGFASALDWVLEEI